MRAVVVHHFGGPEAMAVEEVPDPLPGPNEVLLRVDAVAVNFVDTVVVGGNYQFNPTLPFTPGKGPAGTVVALGRDVTRFHLGDRVLGMAETGGYAELVLVPAQQCFHLPPAVSFQDAASMALAYDTAWFALHERGRLAPGETVLVLGATGAVGFAAMQLAKAAGAQVVAGVSSMAAESLAMAGGADAVVDLGVENLRDGLREQVRARVGGGADVVMDMLGGDAFDAALRTLDWCGRLVVVGFAAGRIPSVKANYLLVKNLEVSGLQISDYRKRRPELMQRCFQEVFDMHASGRIMAQPSRTYPLQSAVQAMTTLLDRSVRERILLVTNSDAAT